MSESDRTPLPDGLVLHGYQITGAPGDDGHVLYYPALRQRDGREVILAEFLPRGLAQRTAGYVEPAFGLDDLYDEERERFDHEVRALASIDHPAVLATLELLRHEGTSYRVQAQGEGQTFASVMASGEPLSQRELYQILDPLLDGLEAIHASGALHHAIGPETVRLRRDGSVLWTGVAGARIGCARALAATAGEGGLSADPYQAPELLRPETPGRAADYYGLAALLYHLTTGQPPQLAQDRLAEDRTLPSAGHASDRHNALFLSALDAGLALDPADRPTDMMAWRPMFRRERRKVL